MVVKMKTLLPVLLLTLLIVYSGLTLATKEPELTEQDDEWTVKTEPEKKLRVCQQQCERQAGQERALCRMRCQQRYESQRGVEEGEKGQQVHRRKGEKEEKESENPYVFEDKHFTTKYESEHGRIHFLQRFDKRSEFLRGLENFRVAIFEAEPQTFVSPAHFDADIVFFVAKGRGTITLFREGKKESFNLQREDIFVLPAGVPAYLVNRDEREKLQLVKFYSAVNLPGKIQTFHGPGGEEQESFFNAFSSELLGAAFKTDRGRLERIFRQSKGEFIKASREQIEALSHGEEGGGGGGIWPFPGERTGPFSLARNPPVHENNYGQFFEVTAKDYSKLKDFDLAVSFANITKGAMTGPYFNSKATKISIILDGEGWFEMACPHVSASRSRSQYQESEARRGRKGGPTYQKIKARLRPGTVFVAPAGHPFAVVAEENNNLKAICFEVNARGNRRYPLAGRKNFVSEMDDVAKELAFGVPAREVDQIFRSQNEEFFFPGPTQQHHRRGRADA